MTKDHFTNPQKCNFLGEKETFPFCQIARIKPLFNFLHAEDKLLLGTGRENFIEFVLFCFLNFIILKFIKRDAEVILVRLVTFLIAYFFLCLGRGRD